ncbi:hypothetical protein Cni_G17650 [Canna indica]|uniref:Cation/H+ exchanger domain-containing protein n=1 Tax=Canna indica TaxID=4628 RepID=A0AAQ3KMR9_9LILI|nr:hypothetical protein Cni_G17650 [Canna indica]
MDTASDIRYLNYQGKNASKPPLVCYPRNLVSTFGIWNGDNPFVYTIPLFLLQASLIIILSRLIAAIIRPLRQPKYVSELIGGFILGPSVMGRIPHFSIVIFPLRSLVILDTIGQLGLIYFVFVVGIEVEKNVIMCKAIKPWAFATACLVPTFVLSSVVSLLINHRLHDGVNAATFLTYLGFFSSVNSFSTIGSILAELKLLNSELGRLALSSSMITHGFALILLSLSIGLALSEGDVLASLWTMLSGTAFILFSLVALKPVMHWVEKHMSKGEEMDEMHTSIILIGVMVWSLISDALGTHAIFGAFMFGLSISNGPLGEALVEKVEDFINGIMMPLVFLVIGLRMDVFSITDPGAAVMLIVVVVACVGIKVLVATSVASMYKMPPYEGTILGFLLNNRGVIDLIVLNIANSKRMLGAQSFMILIVLSVLVTALIKPLIKAVMKPSKHLISYKRRTIWWPNMDSELRLLACVHVPRQTPGLISLLDVTHPTKRSPIFAYALHLVELTGRTSTMILHTGSDDHCDTNNRHAQSRVQAQSDHIFRTFESYEQHSAGVLVQFLIAVSPFATMHEDAVAAAEDRHVALILLPFHKHATVDGGMSPDHPAIRTINQNVLSTARCSVGILIDRGLSSHRVKRRVMLLFVGGPDDREGLALASRMVGHPTIEVTVVRFVHKAKAQLSASGNGPQKAERMVTVTEKDEDNLRDEDCISEFRARCGGGMVQYVERVVRNAEETVAVLREIDGAQDLYVVGRGKGVESPLTAGLTEWTECPELGPIGDMLASRDFGAAASVLVLQQGRAAYEFAEAALLEQARGPS